MISWSLPFLSRGLRKNGMEIVKHGINAAKEVVGEITQSDADRPPPPKLPPYEAALAAEADFHNEDFGKQGYVIGVQGKESEAAFTALIQRYVHLIRAKIIAIKPLIIEGKKVMAQVSNHTGASTIAKLTLEDYEASLKFFEAEIKLDHLNDTNSGCHSAITAFKAGYGDGLQDYAMGGGSRNK